MIRAGHDGDIFMPIDPERFPARLRGLGFAGTTIDTTEYHFRFITRKPTAE